MERIRLFRESRSKCYCDQPLQTISIPQKVDGGDGHRFTRKRDWRHFHHGHYLPIAEKWPGNGGPVPYGCNLGGDHDRNSGGDHRYTQEISFRKAALPFHYSTRQSVEETGTRSSLSFNIIRMNMSR